MRKILIGSSIVLAFLSGCDTSSPPDVSVHLQPLGMCGDLEARVRQGALAEMNAKLDEKLDKALIAPRSCSFSSDEAMPSLSTATNPIPESPNHSETNNQIEGVDEADRVKNDGEYIYLVSGGALRIIKSWPAELTAEISNTPIEGTPKRLFVHGDRALVYSSLPTPGTASAQNSGECTYGYRCLPRGDGHPTLMSLFDISDRAAPRLLRTLKLSGSFLSSRRIDNVVHTVVVNSRQPFPNLRFRPEGVSSCGSSLSRWAIKGAFEVLRRENTEIIESTPLEDIFPSLVESIFTGEEVQRSSNLLAGCPEFFQTPRPDGNGTTTVVSLDLNQMAQARTTTVISGPGTVYASAKSLYLAVPHTHAGHLGWFEGMEGVREATTIHRFRLDNQAASTAYAGSGIIKGRVLNQFSMDEHADHLRVATTSRGSGTMHNTLSVLSAEDDLLVEVGRVDDLARTEDIRSVRFDGDRGYVVTFKKTDPLFVLDLSRPAAPRVMAELKIPGFSTYMHMMDEHHLLTIGYDGDDQGSFAWFAGVRLQIFDVTEMSDPRLIHKEIIGTRGASSEALTNHLAFTYFAPKGVLALPMTICEEGSGGIHGQEMSFSGLMVYDVATSSGFAERGRVDHPVGEDTTCNNWWTQSTSEVKRSVIIEDFVFSISDSLLKVNHLDDLAEDLVTLPIGG